MMERAAARAEELTAIEARIVREAGRFDVGPLLDLLESIGYTRDDVLFESAMEGKSGSIVQAVRFRKLPVRTAIITVELGLLGDNSLLPSYFLHVMERSPDPDRFLDFIRFFDHSLIDNLISATHPDQGQGYVQWVALRKALFRMAAPGTVSTLGWVMQLHFPELRVRAARRPFESGLTGDACTTGVSRLDGTGILGRTYESELPGFLVDLIAEDEADMSGRPWAATVLSRLDRRVLPLLAPFRLPLVVRLVIVWHASWAHVDDPAARERGYLGYERLRGKGEAVHTTVMYRGITGEEPAKTRG
jgi:hypothetical protein